MVSNKTYMYVKHTGPEALYKHTYGLSNFQKRLQLLEEQHCKSTVG